jgi:hypothetical protein
MHDRGALNPFAEYPNTLTVHPGWSEFHYLLAALASLLLLLGVLWCARWLDNCAKASDYATEASERAEKLGPKEGQMKLPLRKDIPWRPEDDALLRELARAGEQVAKIAKHLNRSEGSTRNRALRLNIALAKPRRLRI